MEEASRVEGPDRLEAVQLFRAGVEEWYDGKTVQAEAVVLQLWGLDRNGLPLIRDLWELGVQGDQLVLEQHCRDCGASAREAEAPVVLRRFGDRVVWKMTGGSSLWLSMEEWRRLCEGPIPVSTRLPMDPQAAFPTLSAPELAELLTVVQRKQDDSYCVPPQYLPALLRGARSAARTGNLRHYQDSQPDAFATLHACPDDAPWFILDTQGECWASTGNGWLRVGTLEELG